MPMIGNIPSRPRPTCFVNELSLVVEMMKGVYAIDEIKTVAWKWKLLSSATGYSRI